MTVRQRLTSLDSSRLTDRILVPASGGVLLFLAGQHLLFGTTSFDAVGALLGMLIGFTIGTLLLRDQDDWGEFEQGLAEQAGLISYGLLLTGLSAHIAWQVSHGSAISPTVVAIAAGSLLVYIGARAIQAWPATRSMLEQAGAQ